MADAIKQIELRNASGSLRLRGEVGIRGRNEAQRNATGPTEYHFCFCAASAKTPSGLSTCCTSFVASLVAPVAFKYNSSAKAFQLSTGPIFMISKLLLT